MLGSDHSITLDTAKALGFLCLEEWRWDHADTYLRQAKDSYDHHSETIQPSPVKKALKAIARMIMAPDNQRKLEDVERMARGLSGLRVEIHGRHHPDTLQTATDLAILLQQRINEEADRI